MVTSGPLIPGMNEFDGPRRRVPRFVLWLLAAVIVPQVLLIALAGLIVRAGVGRGLRPLDELQRAVAARSHKDMSALEEKRVPREVRPLVRSVNALLQRLEQVLQLQSRFIADAAHQLKTPVAGPPAAPARARAPDRPPGNGR